MELEVEVGVEVEVEMEVEVSTQSGACILLCHLDPVIYHIVPRGTLVLRHAIGGIIMQHEKLFLL